MADPEYPAWICGDCGQAHGRRPAGICTFHVGTCDICDREEMVTEPRDYGHLKPSWRDAVVNRRGSAH